MTGDSQKANIRLELEQAEEVLKEVEILQAGGFYKGAMSRIYFFVFHLVKALLFSHQ